MLEQGLPFLLFILIAVGLPATIIILSAVLGPPRRKRTTDLRDPYECGVTPFESARRRFSAKFYLIAMLFILFDIEAVFLYPWAVELKHQVAQQGGTAPLVEMLVFIAILVIGYVYVWGRGALEWDR